MTYLKNILVTLSTIALVWILAQAYQAYDFYAGMRGVFGNKRNFAQWVHDVETLRQRSLAPPEVAKQSTTAPGAKPTPGAPAEGKK